MDGYRLRFFGPGWSSELTPALVARSFGEVWTRACPHARARLLTEVAGNARVYPRATSQRAWWAEVLATVDLTPVERELAAPVFDDDGPRLRAVD